MEIADTQIYIKKVDELTESEISSILNAWSIAEWKELTFTEFREKFLTSTFYLLYESETLVSLCRINPEFHFRIGEKSYSVPELVGLVSIVRGAGYGKTIIQKLREDLQQKGMECISFCAEHNRGFYEKCGVQILKGYAKLFMEPENGTGDWVVSEDDDVLNIALKEETVSAIMSLSEINRAYLEIKSQPDADSCKV